MDKELKGHLEAISEASDTISDYLCLAIKRMHALDAEGGEEAEKTAAAKKKRLAAEKRKAAADEKKAAAAKKKDGPKKDDVIAAVQRVIEASDNVQAKKIIAGVSEGAKKVSDLDPEEEYPKVIEACEAWLDENADDGDDDPTG